MEKDPIYSLNEAGQEPVSFNLKEVLMKYLHYWWLFLLVAALALTAAWIYLRYTPPLYSVSSTLLIRADNNKGGGAGGQDIFSDLALFQNNTNKQNEILILSSRTMMERVVRSLALQQRYSVVGNVKTTDLYPDQPFEIEVMALGDSSRGFSLDLHFDTDWQHFRLGEEKQARQVGQVWENSLGRFRIVARPSGYTGLSFRDFRVTWMPLEQAARYYASKLEVKPANDQANVLSLSYIYENPRLASDILNELMVQYNAAAIEDKNETNRKILTFINDRLGLVEGQLDSVELNFEKFRTNRQVIDLSAQSQLYFGSATQLNESLHQQELQLQVVELLEQYLNQPSSRASLVPSTLGLTDPTLQQLTIAYNQLVTERMTELQTGATVENPVVRNLEKNIDEARIKMLDNLANIKKVYQGMIRALEKQRVGVRRDISSIPEKQRQSQEQVREQEIKQNLYLYLMQKREESEIAQASTIANSRIVDRALPVFNRVEPVPLRMYGIALLAGLLIPVLIIYIRELLNDRVITRSDITRATAAPVLGEISHSPVEKVLLFPESSRTIVAEQVRILRSNLRFVMGGQLEKPTILVTSSFSGEGKSFISTNLGAALAASGKRTVILEFDLRKPKILAGLELPKGQGLTNYLVGSATPQELLHAVPQVEDLFIIPCGPVPPNPSEILMTPKVATLFAWLKNNFDAIVIDTAPVGLVSDALTLGEHADATLFVVRQRYTYKRQMGFVEELYRQKKLPAMGILVNDVVTEGARGYYGYGGGYGYGYGYGYAGASGYYEESPKSLWGRLKSGGRKRS